MGNGSDRKVSEYTVYRSLLHMRLHSCRPVRTPNLTPVHRRNNGQQWTREHQNWTTEQWKKVAWSDESRFLLHHGDGRVRVPRIPGEHMAPECTMGRRCHGFCSDLSVSGGHFILDDAHQLKPSPSKTELLVIPGDPSPAQDLALSLNNSMISPSATARNLG
ncbi:hypothetical protein QTP86_027060, partial [Hemibagrus guttatus]